MVNSVCLNTAREESHAALASDPQCLSLSGKETHTQFWQLEDLFLFFPKESSLLLKHDKETQV